MMYFNLKRNPAKSLVKTGLLSFAGILLMCSVGLAEKENPFYKNFQKLTSVSEKKKLLERRIRLSIEGVVKFPFERDAELYFDLPLERSQRATFLKKLWTANKSNKKAKEKIYAICKPIDCILVLKSLPGVSKEALYANVTKNFSYKWVDSVMGNRKEIFEIYSQILGNTKDKKKMGEVLFQIRGLGFYELGYTFIGKNKDYVKNNQWGLLDYCTFCYMHGKYNEALECLGKNADPEFRKHKMFVEHYFVEDKKADLKKFEKLKKEIASFKMPRADAGTLTLELLFFGVPKKMTVSPEVKSFLSKNYFHGFHFLNALKNAGGGSHPIYKEIHEGYKKIYSKHALYKVLMGNINKESLISVYGANSMTAKTFSPKK